MTAKPKFSAAPKPPVLTADQAAFIDRGRGKDRPAPTVTEETQRLSLDVPVSLHARYKAACALNRIKMAPDLLDFIEKRVKELEAQNR